MKRKYKQCKECKCIFHRTKTAGRGKLFCSQKCKGLAKRGIPLKITKEQRLKVYTKERNEKIRIAQQGQNNSMAKRKGSESSNWKGGRTTLRHIIRNTFQYRQWRSDVFTRDEYTCQHCGIKGVYIEAHHNDKRFTDILDEYKIKTIEQAISCYELWNINNGLTLCRKCHDKTKF